MASSQMSPTIQALHDIATISRRNFSTSFVQVSQPVAFDLDIYFPPIPSIEGDLTALGLRSSLIVKLSDAFTSAAIQFRSSSEANLRCAIGAYQQIDAQYGSFTNILQALRSTVITTYTRTLRRMASEVLTTVRAYLSQSGMSSFALPRTIKIRTIPFLSELPSYPTSFPSRKKGWSSPVYKTSGENLHQHHVFSKEDPARPFPFPYTHALELPSRTFPSSGTEFFAEARTIATAQRSSSIILSYTADEALAKFADLCIAKPRTVKVGDTGSAPSSFAIIVKQEDNHAPLCDIHSAWNDRRTRSVSSQVSLDSPAIPFSSKASLRRIARMPKRTSPPLDHIHSTSVSSPSDPPRLRIPSRIPPSPPLTAERTEPVSQQRQRKVAPLPRRRPASTSSHSATSISPPSPAISLSSARCSSPRASLSRVSRTPSLVSLSSSRSTSPSPSDDSIETPPSSPSLHIHGLPRPSYDEALPATTDASSHNRLRLPGKHCYLTDRGSSSQVYGFQWSLIDIDTSVRQSP